MEYRVALAGNPNVGKTSIYNRLTGAFEHVGNWHGVTVAKAERTVKLSDKTVTFSDLPGLYSLSVYSPEEAVSRDELLGGTNDAVVCVCDANNLARNLYLAVQLMEAGVPLIIAVNMTDELKKSGRTINARLLEERLCVPIVEISARKKRNTTALSDKLSEFLDKPKTTAFNFPYKTALPIESFAKSIEAQAQKEKLTPRFAALKAFENDAYISQRLALTDSQAKTLQDFPDSRSEVAKIRYEYIDSVMESVILTGANPSDEKGAEQSKSGDVIGKSVNGRIGGNVYGKSRIDRLALNKYLALPVFLLVMAFIFFITFGLIGNLLSRGLEFLIETCLYNPVYSGLTAVDCPEWITVLVCEGIIAGVGGILVFLPQIVLLFFFLALLEDSGYLSRVAFMTDGLFRKIGLSGRASFTMLMGFGCSATAVLTSRGLEDENMRKKTILLTPFFSCSARLPVYSVIAAAYFSYGSAFVIFGMYLLGIAVSLLIAFIMEKAVKKLKSDKGSFIMEMPPYRFPTAERVYQLIKNNVKVFLIRVGTVIFALNVIVWVLSNFSFTHGFTYGTEFKSIFQQLGSFISPLFVPLGFGGWQAVTALLSGIVAKEIVISSIESMGGVSVIFAGGFAKEAALSFMTFTLLYVPCVATLAAVKKEAGTRFMLLCLAVQLVTAYVFALIVYYAAILFNVNTGLAVGLSVLIPIALITALGLVSFVKNRKKCPYGCGDCDKKCGKDKRDK